MAEYFEVSTSGEVNIDGPLISAEQIQLRVAELAATITSDYMDRAGQLSIIVVLKGACFFAVDLMRQLELPLQIDFLQASSYAGTTSTGEVRLHSDISSR
jgi:hypoxanthine phosphoribosyltransferase